MRLSISSLRESLSSCRVHWCVLTICTYCWIKIEYIVYAIGRKLIHLCLNSLLPFELHQCFYQISLILQSFTHLLVKLYWSWVVCVFLCRFIKHRSCLEVTWNSHIIFGATYSVQIWFVLYVAGLYIHFGYVTVNNNILTAWGVYSKYAWRSYRILTLSSIWVTTSLAWHIFDITIGSCNDWSRLLAFSSRFWWNPSNFLQIFLINLLVQFFNLFFILCFISLQSTLGDHTHM